MKKEGEEIRNAVNHSLREGKVTQDLIEKGSKGLSTSEVGEYLVELIK